MPLTIPEFLRAALARPVAVFGAGVSGQGVQALLRQLGAEGVVYDRDGTPFTKECASRHGLVAFSPGFAPNHPWLLAACTAGLECLGEVDFAACCWRGRVVAVTGTNGKTSLTEFLTLALTCAGETAHAVGNIGLPFSQLAAETAGGGADDIAVCEISSFQAETLQHLRAEATLWTNFAEDHLERHPGMEAYFSAKWNLVVRTAAEGLHVGSSVCRAARALNRHLPATVCVTTEGLPPDPQLLGTAFADYPQRENFVLAAAWWQASGREPAGLYAAAHEYQPGRHRLARVGERDGVVFWNDSKATNFHAVEAALGRFDRPVHWLAGGRGKGGDVAAFVPRIAPRIAHAWLIGETAPQLAAACRTHGVPCTSCAGLEEAVRGAAAAARSGDHVVLSPGFASFDLFRNYQARGDRFEQLVEELGVATNFR
ncbi:MAG: UDP-N-acetylmuramoyl-L-alanine--D-glutamate ligase [Opitutaceae bacterium]|nr:UDP-N-acetylmuramoyl-L-alanine--D-glutamate ligase [Opitutaceae bacterium]